MPLTGTDAALGTALRAALLANPATGVVDNAALPAFCNTLATTILAHLIANGTGAVNPGGTMLAPPGVAGGPVTGLGNLV